jgi:hypothetical protein
MRNKFDGLREDPVADEQRPEERALPLLSVRLPDILCRIVSSLRQRKVDGCEEGAVEEESPLCQGCLEDGVEGPWVALWREGLAKAARIGVVKRGAGLALDDAKSVQILELVGTHHPHVTLSQTSQVAPPVRADPSQTLPQIL